MHIGHLLAIGSAFAGLANAYAVKTPPLDTIWTSQVGTNPWPQHPRPKLQRPQWQSLNGIWTYRAASSLEELQAPPFNLTFPTDVLIPSCLESGLSGVQATSAIYSWLKTTFPVPANWTANERVLLNFGAVDYEATVFVNGRNATFNRGGYSAFSVDVTLFLTAGQNELYACHNLFKSDSNVNSDPASLDWSSSTIRRTVGTL
jgi:beta-galactosidase/beta-glucuronidase